MGYIIFKILLLALVSMLLIAFIVIMARADKKYVLIGRDKQNNFFVVQKMTFFKKKFKTSVIMEKAYLVDWILKGYMSLYTYNNISNTFIEVTVFRGNLISNVNETTIDNIEELPIMIDRLIDGL